MLTLTDVLAYLEQLAPLALAADWDNVGLLLGERARSVSRIMTCLTVTPESAAEAIARQADLIVSHHPVLFKAVRRLTSDTTEGKMLVDLARAGVAIYSPHTALDNAPQGINDQLAAKLGLLDVQPLRRRRGAGKIKLVVFVPESDLAPVSEAIFAAGGGIIGEYRECSFRLAGTGTFHGSDASNPTVGQKGRREEVAEWRLEVVCPESRMSAIVAAMRKAHSYEEPAFDLYPLTSLPENQGEGRLGRLAEPATLESLGRRLQQALNCPSMQIVGEPTQPIQRVAIVCGAGGELMNDALRERADLFVTGEMRFHDCLAARARGLGVLLPGHHATERCGVEDLAARLKAHWPQLTLWASETERDPVCSLR